MAVEDTGCGRSRVLPRHDPLTHILVPGRAASADDRTVHGSRTGLHRARAPLGGLLLGLDGVGGLTGWQWIFVVEGVPSILVGAFLFKLLPDRPATAAFLTPDERENLTREIAAEGAEVRQRHDFGVARSILHSRVLALSLVYFSIAFGLYGLAFWMPQIIKASLAIDSNLQVSLLTAAPYALGAFAMIYWGRRCDRPVRVCPVGPGHHRACDGPGLGRRLRPGGRARGRQVRAASSVIATPVSALLTGQPTFAASAALANPSESRP